MDKDNDGDEGEDKNDGENGDGIWNRKRDSMWRDDNVGAERKWVLIRSESRGRIIWLCECGVVWGQHIM